MIKLKFETITPIHISNGNQLAYNLEYILEDEYVSKLNPISAAKRIAKAGLFDFIRDYKFTEVIQIIEKNKLIFSDSDFDYKIYAVESFVRYLKNERRDGRKIIQEFINANGKFYIPGSSIKGMLTTILNRDPEKDPLGISTKNPRIEDKFVITDSGYISNDNFSVDIALRPPSINIMTLDPGVEFDSIIRKEGNLSIRNLREKLTAYSFEQMKKAKKHVNNYKNMEKTPKGATAYLTILEKMLGELNLDEQEYIVNLGFGGGSYYKLYNNAGIPKFKNPGRRGKKEEAHTTFHVNIENELYQLGWCKLKIEEV